MVLATLFILPPFPFYLLVFEPTYLNPVYEHDFPDPFVLKFGGEYWAICTGFWHDGGCFGILHSRDLIHWKDVGSALQTPPYPEANCYWAPEIFYENGKFYLYYSVGNEENMEIRVAVAEHPAGKYEDSGHRLTTEQFAIDAHVFVDDDNTRWLFYATDFLTHTHIGTGTVRDRMLSPYELEGKPQPVTRAKYDWQVYDPMRASKGSVRWHTIEGSFVLKRKGIYYQMYSGGNWQNLTYGVSFATTHDVSAPAEWQQHSDGEKVLPILRTIPGKVVGPGHNSVVRGTDNRQLYCVYHRWADDLRGRLLAIDRQDFAGERILVLGASTTPQLAPNAPTFSDFFDEESENGLGENWICNDENNWLTNSGAAISNIQAEAAEAVCRVSAKSFLVEVSTRVLSFSQESGYGFSLRNGENVISCLVLPGATQIEISIQTERQIFDLPKDFNPQAFQLWRVEVDGAWVKLKLNEAAFKFEKQLDFAPEQFALTARKASAAFAGFALTVGFEDLFENKHIGIAAKNWQIEKGSFGAWQLTDGSLQCASSDSLSAILKKSTFRNFELVSNLRIETETTAQGSCGFYFKHSSNAESFLTIGAEANNRFFWQFKNQNETRRFDLPETFTPHDFQQFRLRCFAGKLHLIFETIELGEFEISPADVQIGLYAQRTRAMFEMVRVTAI